MFMQNHLKIAQTWFNGPGTREATSNGALSPSAMKTIVGVGYNGVITGGGLDIDGVDNVIIRNLLFQDVNAPTLVGYGSSDPVYIDR